MWQLGHPSSIVRGQEGAAPGLLIGGERPLGCSLQPPGAQQFSSWAPSLRVFSGHGAHQQDTASLLRDSLSRRGKAELSIQSPGFQSCPWLPCLTKRT